jgi:hypothetical protein
LQRLQAEGAIAYQLVSLFNVELITDLVDWATTRNAYHFGRQPAG